ncbi:MAG: hypothetical protein K0S32_310 [Bacteroidetes bacterium]|jgi:hypothetical protein|nr:hypothetical protein [Bacteroidota bacterium]
MKISLSVLSVIFFICLLISFSCKKEEAPQCDGTASTYNSNIKPIIDANCTSSKCHPKFNSYDGLGKYLNNGEFKKKVVDKRQMPKGGSLSSSELSKIQCWIDAGYPEN